MAGETKSNGRKDMLDKFFTALSVVDICLKKIDLEQYDCIIEPSAGNGSFSNRIHGCFAYDISPEDDKIYQQDWLTLDKSIFSSYHNILVIGNPPFGVQNNLAIKFFNEAASFCNTIAFILPKSFNKKSVQNKLDLNFHLISSNELPEFSFTLNGKPYDAPCVFQVWEKQNQKREKIKARTTTPFFDFVKKEDNPDFRIQRVGGNAGKGFLSLDASPQSNYFIKNKSRLANSQFVEIINQLNFPSINETVGPRSLGKDELIEVIEKNLNKDLLAD